MDFTKYVAMLHEGALFFARADQVPDPFEGLAMRRGGVRQRGRADDEALRERVFLSCWHDNEHESAAMWRIYLSGEDGVAIRSNVTRLRDGFSSTADSIHIGKVRYLERGDEADGEEHELAPFFCKRTSFDYEREVRLLGKATGPTEDLGRYIRVDLDRVIEQVASPRPAKDGCRSSSVR